MRLLEPLLQAYALLSLPVEAEKFRGTDVANKIVHSDAKVENIIRVGRSISSLNAPGDQENSHDTSTEAETRKHEDFLRSLRGRDNFIRFGRGTNKNFMRFGRGKQDNFMRFGRSNPKEEEPDKDADEYARFIRSGKGNKKSESEKFARLTKNFIRLGRGKQDNFMRFGRGKQGNFMRFGRGKQDNFMRLGRGNHDNFMRFGRDKQDNFMRFGRGNHDNFMRFGRGKESNYMRFGRDLENFYLPVHNENLDVNYLLHDSGGKYDSFGKHFTSTSDDNVPIAMRSSPQDSNDFGRFSRSRQDNFLRFGKSDTDQQSSQDLDYTEDLKNNLSFNTDNTTPLRDTFVRVMKSKHNDGLNLLRQGRHPPNKDDGFIRFGRNSLDSLSSSSIPQRLKRSTFELDEDQEDILPSNAHEEISDHILLPVISLTDYHDEDLPSSEQLEGNNNRRKRSVKFKPPPSSLIAERTSPLDDVSSKRLIESGILPNIFVVPLFLPPTSSSFSTEK